MCRMKKKLSLLILMLVVFLFPVIHASAASGLPGQVKKLKSSSCATSIRLTWATVSNATGYRVYRVDTKTGKSVRVRTVSQPTCRISKLESNKTYVFQVIAFNKAGKGKPSKLLTTRTYSELPAVPKGLRITRYGNKSITLQWDKVSGAKGYHVSCMNSRGGYDLITTTSSNTVTISGLKAGNTYKYRVQSYVRRDGVYLESKYSRMVSGTAQKLKTIGSAVNKRSYSTYARSSFTAKTVTSGKNVTVPQGTTIVVSESSGTNIVGKMPDGTKIIVPSSSYLKYISLAVYQTDYPDYVKEAFVNSRKYSSKTDYLILISQYTSRISIFKGSQGSWSLIRTAPAVIGKYGLGLTKTGVFELLFKETKYGAPCIYFYWNSYMGWGNSFHRRVSSVSWGSESHGCVRLGDEDLYFINNNCPMGTTVVSY